MDGRCGPMHPHRYLGPAVNRQPGYRRGRLTELLQIQHSREKTYVMNATNKDTRQPAGTNENTPRDTQFSPTNQIQMATHAMD